MLQNLPLEVLENLCLYLNVEDLVNFWDAVGIDGSETFWKKICKRQNYKKISYENNLWKNVFLRNMNWLTQSYERHTFKLEPNVIDAWQLGSLLNKESLLGNHLLFNSCKDETFVWDVRSSPNLVQSLSSKYISHKGNILLTYNSSELAVHSYNAQYFCKLYDIQVKLPFNFLKFCSFTDDYLVIFDKNTCYLKIVYLKESAVYSLMAPITVSMFFSISLSNDFLFLFALEESNYKIMRYDLVDKIWLQDVILFKCAALIGLPQLEISSNLIVSWSVLLEGPGITPVKIFSLAGQHIASLPFTGRFEPSGTEIIRPIENILWVIVECDYLIFSTSKTTVSIWSPENMNYVKVIPKEYQLQQGQKVVSSSLLVLSYSHCFKVIDFKKAVYLYEVFLDSRSSLDSNQSLTFFANEYFYIHFQYFEEDEDNTKTSSNKIMPLESSNCDSNVIRKKKCFVHIYDFTGNYSS